MEAGLGHRGGLDVDVGGVLAVGRDDDLVDELDHLAGALVGLLDVGLLVFLLKDDLGHHVQFRLDILGRARLGEDSFAKKCWTKAWMSSRIATERLIRAVFIKALSCRSCSGCAGRLREPRCLPCPTLIGIRSSSRGNSPSSGWSAARRVRAARGRTPGTCSRRRGKNCPIASLLILCVSISTHSTLQFCLSGEPESFLQLIGGDHFLPQQVVVFGAGCKGGGNRCQALGDLRVARVQPLGGLVQVEGVRRDDPVSRSSRPTRYLIGRRPWLVEAVHLGVADQPLRHSPARCGLSGIRQSGASVSAGGDPR